jgi:hypothetical protein
VGTNFSPSKFTMHVAIQMLLLIYIAIFFENSSMLKENQIPNSFVQYSSYAPSNSSQTKEAGCTTANANCHMSVFGDTSNEENKRMINQDICP